MRVCNDKTSAVLTLKQKSHHSQSSPFRSLVSVDNPPAVCASQSFDHPGYDAAMGSLSEEEPSIFKPGNDDREYRKIVLRNALRVLLISDPDTDKAAASMDLHIGSFSDPLVLVKALPVQERHTLLLMWPITPEIQNYHAAPLLYLAHMVGHEADGSLFSLLKQLGWANSLIVGETESTNDISFFVVDIELTDVGQVYMHEVVELTFQYLSILQKQGVENWILEELQDVSDMKFHFQDKKPLVNYTTHLANNMQLYPAEHWLSGPLLLRKFDSEVIARALSQLTVQNVRIFWYSKEFQGIATEVKPWYGTSYMVEKINDSVVKDWQAAQIDSRLHLPSPAVCIPKDSSLVKVSEPKVQFPSVLKKTPMFGLVPAHVLCVGCLVVLCSCNVVVCVSATAASPGDPTADVLFPYLLQDYLAMYHIFAFLATVLCCAGAVWVGSVMRVGGSRYRSVSRKKLDVSSKLSISGPLVSTSATNGWGGHEHLEKYSSMVEELVPEITQHALSYLDYKSLCQVSKTNSAMRRVADDDSAWRALYRKDFSSEQDYVRPRNGWKAHYAVTKAVSRANKKFYQKFKTKSLRGMKGLWLKADYVKCIHPGGELLSGYDVIMENWRIVFNWSQRFDFELEDVRVRVVGDIAWVTAKEFINSSRQPLLATNCYEYQDGKWFIVHHHSSPQVEGGGPDFGLFV